MGNEAVPTYPAQDSGTVSEKMGNSIIHLGQSKRIDSPLDGGLEQVICHGDPFGQAHKLPDITHGRPNPNGIRAADALE